MWFFAVLVVLVMGGVAALAAGRGAPMADAYDDRPDALVPREGPLGGDDLRRVRFSLAFRGYRMSEVDALLDRLAGQLDQVHEAGHSTVGEHPGAGVDGDSAGQGPVAGVPPVPEVRGDEPAP
jgi:DivIVA domain-containing protein